MKTPRRNTKENITYTAYSPDHLGFALGTINENGDVLYGSYALEAIISQIKRGTAKERALVIRCVPNIPYPKEKDVRTLGQLFGNKIYRGTPMPQNLTPISENNRYKGKIDWREKKPFILNQIRRNKSIRDIAKMLGVSPSTISMANRKYGLYKSRK